MSDAVVTLGSGRNVWRVSDGLVDMSRDSAAKDCVEIPTSSVALRFATSNAALVVVDMQNYFVHPRGRGGDCDTATPGMAIVDQLNAVIAAARAHSMPIVWLNWGHNEDGLGLPPALLHAFRVAPGCVPTPAGYKASVLVKGSWEAAVYDGLHTSKEDAFVDKQRISGCFHSQLDDVLRSLGRQTLFFAGVNTDQCVMGTIIDASNRGYDCVLLEDCSASTSPDFVVKGSLHNLVLCYGFLSNGSSLVSALCQS